MGTLFHSHSRVSMPDAYSKGRPKKQLGTGNLPLFNTNYRPAGRREEPNSVTPGSAGARLQGRYAEGDQPSFDLGRAMVRFW